MAIDLPFSISAVPGVPQITALGLPSVGTRVTGQASSRDDANGPHVLLASQALAEVGVSVETTAEFITTQIAPDLAFRITTGSSIADVRIFAGLFRKPPADPSDLDFECAAFRYSTDTDGTAYWRTITCDSAGTVESTTTSAAIAASTEYVLRIAHTSTSATFYVNGTSVATHSANVADADTAMRVGVYLAPLVDSSKEIAFGYIRAGQVDHGQTAGLLDDDHAQYALLAGRASGQTIKGGTASGESLTLQSTSNATRGGIRLSSSDWLDVPEVSAPATPASGRVAIYAKSDGLVYAKDDAGSETQLSNGAGGAGDVSGPGSATDSAIALFNGTSGKVIKDSTYTITAAGAALLDDASAAAQRTTLGLGTGDSPQFSAINVGHSSDTTITRSGSGDIAVEGNAVYRMGGADVAVADGGTGASTAQAAFDALSPVTTRGDIIVRGASNNARLAIGASNTVLKSDGTDPGWGLPDGCYLGTQVITTGTTTVTSNASATKWVVEGWAAGGGGGGCASAASSGSAGGGGAAGGYWRTVATVAASTGYTCAVGAKGSGGANTGGTGSTGGDTTLTVGATTYTAKGGLGGVGQAAGTTPAVALGGAGGGVSTNASVNGSGACGGWGQRVTGTLVVSGGGGSCSIGAGGNSRSTGGAGNAATGYGSGGGGAAVSNNSGAVAGGDGADGLLLVHEYTS